MSVTVGSCFSVWRSFFFSVFQKRWWAEPPHARVTNYAHLHLNSPSTEGRCHILWVCVSPSIACHIAIYLRPIAVIIFLFCISTLVGLKASCIAQELLSALGSVWSQPFELHRQRRSLSHFLPFNWNQYSLRRLIQSQQICVQPAMLHFFFHIPTSHILFCTFSSLGTSQGLCEAVLIFLVNGLGQREIKKKKKKSSVNREKVRGGVN